MTFSPNEVFTIVPFWFAKVIEEATVSRLLSETLDGSERIADPGNHFLYLDGVDHCEPVVKKLIDGRFPESVLVRSETNDGKGRGVLAGLEAGLSDPAIQWLMVRDADGDHRAADAPAMLELGELIRDECRDVPILVIGGRHCLEPPLTFYRAAYEHIINRITQASIQYALSKINFYQDQTYFRQYGETPDIQSGFKLYNRLAAERIVDRFRTSAAPLEALYRWGAELPPYVAVVLEKGIIGETRRSTYREQPVTAYGSIERAKFYAQKAVWVFQTCELSLWNTTRILDNELTYTPLMFDGMGRMELMQFRKAILESVQKRTADQIPPFRGGVKVI